MNCSCSFENIKSSTPMLLHCNLNIYQILQIFYSIYILQIPLMISNHEHNTLFDVVVYRGQIAYFGSAVLISV